MEEQITVRSVYWLNVYTQRISGYQLVGFGWLSDFVSRDIEYKGGRHCLSKKISTREHHRKHYLVGILFPE